MDNKDTDRRTYGRILDRMRMLCSRREYSSAEMFRKISASLEKSCPGRDEDDIMHMAAEAVASLVKDRYVDDMRYACAFARDKAVISGWGAVKIRRALAVKGLEKDMIDEALASVDLHESSERLEKVLQTKFRSLYASAAGKTGKVPQGQLPMKQDLRIRLLRFAACRGYGYDEAAPVVERLVSEI